MGSLRSHPPPTPPLQGGERKKRKKKGAVTIATAPSSFALLESLLGCGDLVALAHVATLGDAS